MDITLSKPGSAPVTFTSFRSDPAYDGVREVLITSGKQRLLCTLHEAGLMVEKLVKAGCTKA